MSSVNLSPKEANTEILFTCNDWRKFGRRDWNSGTHSGRLRGHAPFNNNSHVSWNCTSSGPHLSWVTLFSVTLFWWMSGWIPPAGPSDDGRANDIYNDNVGDISYRISSRTLVAFFSQRSTFELVRMFSFSTTTTFTSTTFLLYSTFEWSFLN